jgi:hypothetical protein
MGGDKFSVVWCQPIGLTHTVGREGGVVMSVTLQTFPERRNSNRCGRTNKYCSLFWSSNLLPLSVCPCPLLHKWVLVSLHVVFLTWSRDGLRLSPS